MHVNAYILQTLLRNLKKYLLTILFGIGLPGGLLFSATAAQAEGGLSIQGTRIVYPQKSKQVSVLLTNNAMKDVFLVQSWVEDNVGEKTKDFVVTPPLYVSNPKDSNTLRLMYTGKPLPQDRESLYFFVAKAIPSIEKRDAEGKNVLIMAAANRIKLFVRPEGLKPDVSEAPAQLTFKKAGAQLEIMNSGPYYLTMTDIKVGTHRLDNIMVPPKDKVSVALPAGSGNSVHYRTINDEGALTPELTRPVK